MAITAIVDTDTSIFVVAGHVEDARYVKVTLSRNPNHLTERYTGDPQDPFRAATAQELADVLTAQQDAAAAQEFDTLKMLKAKGISDLAFRLGKAPGALTPGEIAAERTRILNIYKGLS